MNQCNDKAQIPKWRKQDIYLWYKDILVARNEIYKKAGVYNKNFKISERSQTVCCLSAMKSALGRNVNEDEIAMTTSDQPSIFYQYKTQAMKASISSENDTQLAKTTGQGYEIL